MTSASSPRADMQSSDLAVRRRRAAGLIIVVLIMLCLLFVASYVQKLSEKAAVAAQIAAVEQQIAQAKVRTAILSKELAQVNDDAHIAAVARDALNLVQEGDQLIAIVDAPAPPAPPGAASTSVRAPLDTNPNWQRWVDLLFPN